jgi:hypothetical protein
MHAREHSFSTLSRAQAALADMARDADPERKAYLHELCRELYVMGSQLVPARLIVFAPAPGAPGWWLVGPEGQERRLHGPMLGLRAAHAALVGDAPLCAAYARPGTANPGQSIREAVRTTGAAWADDVARCPELASALRSMSVAGDPPRLQYAPRPGAPVFVRSAPPFTQAA